MYIIIDENNVCIGMLENYNAAVSVAKKLGAKAIKEIDNVSALGNISEPVWVNTYDPEILCQNRIGAIVGMVIAIIAAIVSHSIGETYGVSIILLIVSVVMFFSKDKCFYEN